MFRVVWMCLSQVRRFDSVGCGVGGGAPRHDHGRGLCLLYYVSLFHALSHINTNHVSSVQDGCFLKCCVYDVFELRSKHSEGAMRIGKASEYEPFHEYKQCENEMQILGKEQKSHSFNSHANVHMESLQSAQRYVWVYIFTPMWQWTWYICRRTNRQNIPKICLGSYII